MMVQSTSPVIRAAIHTSSRTMQQALPALHIGWQSVPGARGVAGTGFALADLSPATRAHASALDCAVSVDAGVAGCIHSLGDF